VRCANQAEVALVDQVGQGDALVLVFLGDGYDEPQVGAHQLVQRLRIVLFDSLREGDLFLSRDQRILADFPQILIQRTLIK
jgi:hypothetical protein